MNLLLVVLWAFALPYPRFRPMASCLCTVWTCVIIVCKMLYQLKVVSPHEYSSNCTEVRPRPAPIPRGDGVGGGPALCPPPPAPACGRPFAIKVGQRLTAHMHPCWGGAAVWPAPVRSCGRCGWAILGAMSGSWGGGGGTRGGAGADSPFPQPLLNSTNLQKTEIKQSLLYRGPVDPANWFGVRKGFPNLGYVQVREGPQGRGAGAGGPAGA